MQFTLATFTALLSAAVALTTPDKRQTPFRYRELTFKLSSGPASYTLNVTADGNLYATYNTDAVSLVELTSQPNFNIYLYCNYYTNGPKQLSGSSDGRILAVGPPQPVTGISCQPTSAVPGQCLPNYATCAWSSQQSGTFLSCCQSGYCAANKCRPTS